MISLDAYRCSIANADLRQFKIVARKKMCGYHCIGVRWSLLIVVLLIIGCVEVNPGPGIQQNCNKGGQADQVKLYLIFMKY